MSEYILPIIIIYVIGFGLFKKIDVYESFVVGVSKGIDVCIKIFPIMLGLITAIYMLRASGAIEIFSNILQPVTSLLGIPKECTVLVLLKPISAGGGLAIGSEIMSVYGVDSYIGKVSAVILASSETSFYTMSVYYGSLGISKMRYTIIAALTADIVAFVVASHIVKFL
ncbi:MAG: nucleoside recognition domain-containing protein [Clostridia bacterium]